MSISSLSDLVSYKRPLYLAFPSFNIPPESGGMMVPKTVLDYAVDTAIKGLAVELLYLMANNPELEFYVRQEPDFNAIKISWRPRYVRRSDEGDPR